MNLNGKYIEINKNNVKPIITFLYSKGYKWTMGLNLKGALDCYKSFIINDGISYIIIENKQFFFLYYKPINKTYYDIHKLMREVKLKRVLGE